MQSPGWHPALCVICVAWYLIWWFRSLETVWSYTGSYTGSYMTPFVLILRPGVIKQHKPNQTEQNHSFFAGFLHPAPGMTTFGSTISTSLIAKCCLFFQFNINMRSNNINIYINFAVEMSSVRPWNAGDSVGHPDLCEREEVQEIDGRVWIWLPTVQAVPSACKKEKQKVRNLMIFVYIYCISHIWLTVGTANWPI